MKRFLALLLLFSLALGLLAGCGSRSEGERDAISIWYIENEPGAEGLIRLAGEYNEGLAEGLLPVSLRGFTDEESLAAAFDSGRPDMLLCSYLKADDLYERELLRDLSPQLSASRAYPGYLEERFEYLGRGFFPIGMDVLLLMAGENVLTPEMLRHPDGLCTGLSALSGEGRRPIFTAEDCAALFYQWLLNLETEFHGDASMDMREENYKYVYNLLAEAAYGGAFVSMDYPAAELVRGGYLYCAVLNSTSVGDEEGAVLKALPLFSDSRVYLSGCIGLAVTAREGRSRRSMAAFTDWLMSEGRAGVLALESGLVPAVSDGLSPEGPLQALLFEIGRDYTLHIPDAGCDYIKNRGEFEGRFRAAVAELGYA